MIAHEPRKPCLATTDSHDAVSALTSQQFGTGDGITFEAPFGHGGERLHEWMFGKTRAGDRRVAPIWRDSVPLSFLGAPSPRSGTLRAQMTVWNDSRPVRWHTVDRVDHRATTPKPADDTTVIETSPATVH